VNLGNFEPLLLEARASFVFAQQPQLRAQLIGATRAVQDAHDEERTFCRQVGDEVGVDGPEAERWIIADVEARVTAAGVPGKEPEGAPELVEHCIRTRPAALQGDRFGDREEIEFGAEGKLVGRV
jgi:hypothetical protein